MKGILLLMSMLLAGCASTPPAKPVAAWLRGELHFDKHLPRPAMVEVTVLSVLEGRMLPVATMRYEVTMLPLSFALRLTPLQWGQGDLYLRSRLYFVGERAMQASAQQKVFKAFNRAEIEVHLSSKICYPTCQ
ncbi:MAG: YscW family type III secretion system pilotin [Aeromonas sp.]